MTHSAPSHLDRRRAGSFGSAATAYDRHRPRYPDSLIADLVDRPGIDALDVGSGTGIMAAQLRDAGARVLAVEPDPRMAAVARDKGLDVEDATFEGWPPGGRTFDLVVFAQSFHWLEPGAAAERAAALLRPGGRLALVWNRYTPVSPSRDDFDAIYADYPGVVAERRASRESELAAVLTRRGLRVERRDHPQTLTIATDDWLDMTFTYSRLLLLDPSARGGLRHRLAEMIGPRGVEAANEAFALICTRAVAV